MQNVTSSISAPVSLNISFNIFNMFCSGLDDMSPCLMESRPIFARQESELTTEKLVFVKPSLLP